MPTKYQTKRGVASIYIIVVTSLLFAIITIGFIHLILNEVKKSTENSLSQSAYDSALAGIEDAKSALSQYYTCLNENATLTESAPNGDNNISCEEKLYYINYDASHPDYCDSVANILNRNGESATITGTEREVLVQEESTTNSNVTQAYTCVKLNTTPSDYRSTLSSTNSIKVIPLKPTIDAANIKKIRISWFSITNGTEYNFNNVDGYGNIRFNSLNDSSAATPPTIVAQLYQTAETFSLTQFNNSVGEATNRGTLWLVPSDVAGSSVTSLNKQKLIDSNNHDATVTNHGYAINCRDAGSSEFACSVEIELPDPVGGARSTRTGTFLLVLSLPYSQPNTDFKVEMLSDDGTQVYYFDNIQIAIDSTGRANDIYRRVEGRVEFYDINFPFPEYAMQLGAGSDGESLSKKFWVTYNCWSAADGSPSTCNESDFDN